MERERERIHGLLDEATSVDLCVADLAQLSSAFGAVRRLQSALDGYTATFCGGDGAARGVPREADERVGGAVAS